MQTPTANDSKTRFGKCIDMAGLWSSTALVPSGTPARWTHQLQAHSRRWACCMACVLPMSASVLAASEPAAAPAARSALVQTRLMCHVTYLPTRASWDRQVTLGHSAKQLRAVSIDGVAVYSFGLQDKVVMTALDNERIQIDLSRPGWVSDFRGMASGLGWCELLP